MDLSTDIQVLLLKGLISNLPEEEQAKIEQCAAAIREAIKGRGGSSKIALSLVIAEHIAGDDEERVK